MAVHAPELHLAGVDLTLLRPWVMVVMSPGPASHGPPVWEPALIAAGYEPCLFDGVSRFYAAREHPELRAALSYPACIRDDFVDAAFHALQLECDSIADDASRWRAEALTSWANANLTGSEDLAAARRELAALRGSLSWRITRPLRALHLREGRR